LVYAIGLAAGRFASKAQTTRNDVDNPQHYTTIPYAHSRLYLILNCVFGATLMLLIIGANSPWTVAEKIAGSILLWHLIINWGGILDARKWVFVSE
jgi:hypothetical protein